MIQTDGYAYMWTDNVAQGTKFKIDSLQNFSPSPGMQSQATDLNTQVDMKCSDWLVDSTKFEVPANIKFTDMTELTKNLQPITSGKPTASGNPKIDKSVCDNIQEESAKAACVRALESN